MHQSDELPLKKLNLKSGIDIKYRISNLKGTKNKYTSKFKLAVIQYRKINNCSVRETALNFNITNPSTISNLEHKYREKGLSDLDGKIGRSRKNMCNDKSRNNQYLA